MKTEWERRQPRHPPCIADKTTKVARAAALIAALDCLPPLQAEHLIPPLLTFEELQNKAGGGERDWGDEEWLATVHQAAVAQNAPPLNKRELQRIVQRRFPRNSRLVVSMRELAKLVLELPAQVIAHMPHRYVYMETFRGHKDMMGRPKRIVPTIVTLSFPRQMDASVRELPMSGCRREGSTTEEYYAVVICPTIIMREYLRSGRRAADYFKGLGGYFPNAVKPIDSMASLSRKVSLKVHLILYTLWNLIVQPRHFFIVTNDAAYEASCWAGFLGIPVSDAFMDLRDLWLCGQQWRWLCIV